MRRAEGRTFKGDAHRGRRSRSRGPLAALALLVASAPAPGIAEEVAGRPQGAAAADEGRPVARAIRVASPPALDGVVLGDLAWDAAIPVSGFRQTTPDEGQPASQRTEVRIVHTDDAVYFGIVCYDDDPSKIIIADSRRDSSLTETDSFQIVIDTHLDRQNGFVFGTNPAGIEYDGQVTREGDDEGFNLNWDGSWRVRAAVSEIGWSAEFEIPFRTLRYPRADDPIWGLNFQRNIRRRNEQSFWSPLPRQFGLMRLSLAGTLTGLRLPAHRNLKFVPYGLGEASRAGELGSETHLTGEAGFDLKYGITPSLTLDVTYNTDFAQVEVDEQQINLNRFNLFFPEKRPFFLENAGLFSVGVPGQIEIFFSRRIGLGGGGEVVPIEGGARVSGKIGRTGFGFLTMQTDETPGVADANNYSVARFRRELPRRSSVGVIATNRQAAGDPVPGDEYNRALAIDGRAGIGRYGEIAAFVARTFSPGIDDDQLAFRIGTDYDSEAWFLSLDYTEVRENFDPQVGFLHRTAYRKGSATIFHRYRPAHFLGLQELRPHAYYEGYWDFEGFQETGFLHLDNHWEWKNGHEIHTGINFTREGVKTPFAIVPGVTVPPGTYDHDEIQFIAFTNEGAPVSVRLDATFGGFFGGDRVELAPSLRVRAGETFNAEIAWIRNDIDLPGGSFLTNLGRARITYSFTPKVFLQTLFQYNDRDDLWSANLRFGWLQTANIGLFVVYNEIQGIGAGGPARPDRSLVVKLSRQFELLR